MTKAEEIFEKHLKDYDTTSYTQEDRDLKQCYLNAINEALSIHGVVESLPPKLKITFEQWKKDNKITTAITGGYLFRNKIFTNHQLHQVYIEECSIR